MTHLNHFRCFGLLLILVAGMLASCGKDQQYSALSHLANPRIEVGFNGFATCTGEPNLVIRNRPSATASVSTEQPYCDYGQKAWVETLVWDATSGQYFARLPGWGDHSVNGRTFGYADWRWLQAPGSPTGDHNDAACSISHDNAYAVLGMSSGTRAILSAIGFSEGTGNCYNYMYGYKRFDSYAVHPRECRPFGNTCSTAAGRYQFLDFTWDEIAAIKGLSNFGPKNQDIGGIYLLDRRGFTNHGNKLSYTQFVAAMNKISWEWASLPPGRYGQGYKSMSTMWQKYQKYVNQ